MIKSIAKLCLFFSVSFSAFCDVDPFLAQPPVKQAAQSQQPQPVIPIQSNPELLKQAEEARKKAELEMKLDEEKKQGALIFQLKRIGRLNGYEIYKNSEDNCLIKIRTTDNKPDPGVCFNSFLERVRGSAPTKSVAGNQQPRPNQPVNSGMDSNPLGH